MEDGVLAQPDSTVDLDFMDELFSDGFWLETTDGPGYPTQSSGALLDSSFFWPPSGNNENLRMNPPSQTNNQEELQRPFLTELQEEGPAKIQSPAQRMVDVVKCSGQSVNPTMEGRQELSRRIWISPTENRESTSFVMDRLLRALVYMKDAMRDKDVLVQVWLPVNRGGRRVLTTNHELSSLDNSCPRLAKYHNISMNYQFSTGEDSKELVKGLPGRVFTGKVPEWTPDVRFFRSDEYPRVDEAQRYDVRGTLALPIFEQGSRTCLGVIEVVTTSQKMKYQPELENICKALEAVDLQSSEKLNTQIVKANDRHYQAALPEIQEVMRSACETHNLPLAQTWVLCIQQGKDGCRHSDDNYAHCVSTVDRACHVTDPYIQLFHEACSEHHLLKGQGIVGTAFMTNQPCFSSDITSLSKTEYPLSHHARMFGLHAAVAIRLRSIHTGSTDFVLEFFLPSDCRDSEEHKKMLTSLSSIIQNICHSLRVVTDKELEEEMNFPVSEVIVPSYPRTSGIACSLEVQQTDNEVSVFPMQKLRNIQNAKSSMLRQQDSNLGGIDCVKECSAFGEVSFSSVGASKTGEKRRARAEKAITLEVLRKHFSGSLKDAAKSLGVCSTTLKRICRQHGILRWPSRKIKKVGHSLEKLQRVIDSVQGASSAFQINSFYTSYPELASPNFSGTSPFSTSKPTVRPKPTIMPPEGGVLSPQATASKSPSSSCSHSSSSSQCCSSRIQQHHSTWNVAGNNDLIVRETSSDGVLKRVRSDAELNALRQDGMEIMRRSQSHKLLSEQHNEPFFRPSLKNGQTAQEGETQRVKVAYGDEKTRFRIQNNWGYEDLVQETAKRFGIEDMSKFDIKYLDDDLEWVLLTCDADLEECLDVCRSSKCNTIKLSLQLSRRHLERFSGSSCPP